MVVFMRRCLSPLVGGQHHDHVSTIDPRFELDLAHACNLFGDAIKNLLAELRPVHFASTEHNRQLDFVAFGQELGDLLGLGIEVSWTDLHSVLHFLDADVLRLATRLASLLSRIELELPIIHDPAHRRIGHGSHFDEVEVLLACDAKGFGQRLYAQLRSLCVDEADFTGPDTFIYPWLVRGRGTGYAASLLG